MKSHLRENSNYNRESLRMRKNLHQRPKLEISGKEAEGKMLKEKAKRKIHQAIDIKIC
jgi:hypothetical protein